MNFNLNTMIVAITASENNMNTVIDERFGRSPFFCLYDTATGNTEFRENALKEGAGGVGPQVVEFLGNLGVNKVFAVEFGPKAKDVLDKLRIETQIIKSGQTVREIINMCND